MGVGKNGHTLGCYFFDIVYVEHFSIISKKC